MSTQPIITFKAGQCDLDKSSQPWRAKPLPTPGYIYMYIGDEDGIVHFCWRPRSAPANAPTLDLIMVPGDATFLPYTGPDTSASSENVTSPGTGRIFVLKFSSSSLRHLFWMQSKSQHPNGRPNWFSQRDLKIGQIVDMLLQGEEVDVQAEMEEVRDNGGDGGRRDDDGDEDMEDAPPTDTRLRSNSTGGAGAGATGGDIREEGEEAREGGADGGRAASASAPNDASSVVQNFLNSLTGGGTTTGGGAERKIFTTLSDLLTPETCVPVINSANTTLIDSLLVQLPPTVLIQSQQPDASLSSTSTEPSHEAVDTAIQAMSLKQKRDLLIRVIRSPQLHQSLSSLTAALRDGGLPMVAQALSLDVENGGLVRGGNVPLGGGDAVEAFVEGVKRTVKKRDSGAKEGGDDDKMDTT